MDTILRGNYFIANGFEVRVALKKGFENGHRTIKIDVESQQMGTGIKSNFSIPLYNLETADAKFFRELERVKNYYSAPALKTAGKINPIDVGCSSFGI